MQGMFPVAHAELPKKLHEHARLRASEAFYHAMQKDGLFEDYKELADRTCNSAKPQLDAHMLIACNRDI